MGEKLLMKGNEVIAEAALRAGCRHYFGYPITPQTEVAHYMAKKMEQIGVRNVICTDISKDGAMRGTNLALYRQISEKWGLDITASGGVSTLEDVRKLREMNLYGAIIGKAYYTGAIDLKEALEAAK